MKGLFGLEIVFFLQSINLEHILDQGLKVPDKTDFEYVRSRCNSPRSDGLNVFHLWAMFGGQFEDYIPYIVFQDHDYNVEVRRVLSASRARLNIPINFRADGTGYYSTTLGYTSGGRKYQKTTSLHRVACASLNGPPTGDKLFACHKDGNSENNSALNLYWGSINENSRDRVKHGTSRTDKHFRGNEFYDQLFDLGYDVKSIVQEFGLPRSTVFYHHRRRRDIFD